MLRRLVVIAVMVCLSGAAGSAQTLVSSSDSLRQAIRASVATAPQAATKASVNVKLTRETRETLAASPARTPQGKKNFWKTPWPYVIVVGVAAAVVVIAKNGVGGGGGGY